MAPISLRVKAQIPTMACKDLHDLAPVNLLDIIPYYSLASSFTHNHLPFFDASWINLYSPILKPIFSACSALSLDIYRANSLTSFRSSLRCHFFNDSYPDHFIASSFLYYILFITS